MLKYIALFIVFFLAHVSFSQDLRKMYSQARSTSDISLTKEVNILAKQKQDIEVLANSYFLLAYQYKKIDSLYEAVFNYFEALSYYRDLKDFARIAQVMKNIGNIYEMCGFSSTALNYYSDAIELEKQLHDSTGLAMTYYNVGQLFSDLDRLDSALMYYELGLSLAVQLKSSSIGRFYNDLGVLYRTKGINSEALNYYDLADQYDSSVAMRARTLNNRGYLYLQNGDTVTAVKYLKQALELDSDLVEKRTYSIIYSNLGRVQFHLDSAIFFYEKSFSYLKDNPFLWTSTYYEITVELEKLYRQQNNEEQAQYYDDLQGTFTLKLIDLQEKLQLMSQRYQVEAATWKFQTEQREEELRVQNRMLIYMTCALLLALIGLGIYFIRYKRRKEIDDRILKEAEVVYKILKA